jgi:hypothetical protein
MPISGSDPALHYSIAGTMRAGASRSGYYPKTAYVFVNSVNQSSSLIVPSLSIEDVIDDGANTASFRVRGSSGFTPLKYQRVQVSLGTTSNRIFSGYILRRQLLVKKASTRYPRWQLDCVDATWVINHKRCTPCDYTSTSATTIITDLMTASGLGFSVTRVETGMPAIDFQSNHKETLGQAFTRVMKMVNGWWYIDEDEVVHAFITPESSNLPTALEVDSDHWWGFSYSDDASQVRNRQYLKGGGSSTTAAVAAGAAIVPLDDVTRFGSLGGKAYHNTNIIIYTGKSASTGPGNLTGCSGISNPIEQGAQISVYATQDDTASQSTIAAAVGTDGIIEEFSEDSRLNDAAASDAAFGKIELFGDPDSDQTVEYTTRDIKAKSGKTLTVNISTPVAISTTLVIQRVRVYGFDPNCLRYPLRRVEAANARKELQDLLRLNQTPEGF